MKSEETHAKSAEKCSEVLNVTLCRLLGVTVLAGTWDIWREAFSQKIETDSHTFSIRDIWILTIICCVSEREHECQSLIQTWQARQVAIVYNLHLCFSLLDLKLEGPSNTVSYAITVAMVPMNSQWSLVSLSTSLHYARFYNGMPRLWYHEEMQNFT